MRLVHIQLILIMEKCIKLEQNVFVCFEIRGLALFCDTLYIQIFIQQNTLHFCENDQTAGGERVNEHYYLTLLRN